MEWANPSSRHPDIVVTGFGLDEIITSIDNSEDGLHDYLHNLVNVKAVSVIIGTFTTFFIALIEDKYADLKIAVFFAVEDWKSIGKT